MKTITATEASRVLSAITSVVEVLPYTEETAEHHARLLAHVGRTGRPLLRPPWQSDATVTP